MKCERKVKPHTLKRASREVVSSGQRDVWFWFTINTNNSGSNNHPTTTYIVPKDVECETLVLHAGSTVSWLWLFEGWIYWPHCLWKPSNFSRGLHFSHVSLISLLFSWDFQISNPKLFSVLPALFPEITMGLCILISHSFHNLLEAVSSFVKWEY